jgi:PAS domain S-box-containing protein
MGIPLKLLLIEDSPDDADLVVLKLEKSGYDVSYQRVEDGAHMWESLKQQTWDVIISDHNLPQFDSLRALQVLKDSGLDIPFIIVSGAIGEDIAVRAMKSGAQDYVPKDNLMRLAAVVEHAVADTRGRTARRHAEDALVQSEAYLKLAAKATSFGIYAYNFTTRQAYYSPEFLELFGLPFDASLELDTDGIAKALHPDDKPGFLAEMNAANDPSGSGILDYEYRIIRADGQMRWLRMRGLTLFSGNTPNDRPLHANGVVQDITRRKLSEQTLLESEERFRSLYENSTIGLYRTTPDGQILLANSALVKMLGYESFADLNKRNLEEEWLEPGYARHKFIEAIETHGKVYGWESAWTRKDGTRIYIRESAIAIRDAQGHTLYYDGTVEDITERKQAEEALKSSQDKYHNLFNNAPVGMYRTKIDGSAIIEVNKTLCDITGYSRKELLDNPSYITWAYPEKRMKLIEQLQKNGYVENYEFDVRTKDGSIKTCLNNIRLYPQKGYLEGSFVDISERKKAEEALRNAAEEWRSTFDSISDMVALIDVGHRILRVNRAFAQAVRIPPDKLIGRFCYEVVHQASQPHKDCPFIYTKASGQVCSYEIFENTLGISLECTTSPLLDSDHHVIGTVHIFKDITERKQAEKTLVVSEKFSRAIIDNSPVGIAVRDKYYRLLNYNQAWVDLWGMTPERIAIHSKNMTYEEFHILMDHLGEYFDAVENLFQKGGSLSIPELKVTRYESKEALWIKQYFYAMRNTDGEVERVIILTVDITDRKQAEEENRKLREKAEVSSRLAAIGEMAAGIAHEINNPLTGVIGFSELLLENPNLPADIRDQIRIIAEGGNRVRDIVKRMLTFARQHKPVKNSLNIHQLIDNTLEIRSYVLRTANIEVIKHYDPDLPWVVVDPGQMQQVFLNLIVNAEYSMKKAQDRGTLTISTARIDGHIRISFRDDGAGMDNATREKLFQPFFTTKAVNEGTGLGLSLSRGIILEHGGTIEVESEVGKGATFIITLPLTQPIEVLPDTLVPATTTLSPVVKPARILVVDDEKTIQGLVSAVLSHSGHTVDATGDAAEALTKLESTAYDVVLMDIRMPGMSGMELYAKVIEQHPEMKNRFIFITGDTSDAQTRVFLEQNNLPFITKPFDRDTLEQRVNGLL